MNSMTSLKSGDDKVGRRAMRLILVTEDAPLLHSLQSEPACHPELELLTVTERTDMLARLIGESSPDVVVLDMIAPTPDIIEQTKALATIAKVVFVSQRSTVDDVLQAIRAGARGFINRTTVGAMVAAINAVAEGKVVIEPSIAPSVVEDVSYLRHREASASAIHVERFTARELQILSLIAEGYTSKQIASQLGLGVRTVKAHVANTMSKMAAHSRSQAVAIAASQKLILMENHHHIACVDS